MIIFYGVITGERVSFCKQVSLTLALQSQQLESELNFSLLCFTDCAQSPLHSPPFFHPNPAPGTTDNTVGKKDPDNIIYILLCLAFITLIIRCYF